MYKLLIIIIALLFCIILPTLRVDEEGYTQLAKSSEPKEMRAYCQQFREGVSKAIWGDQVCEIQSDKSELFFFSHDGEIELIEELDALECVLQEERFYRQGEPVQLVRLLRAKEARFNYNTQLLKAHDVQMWSYELPGHTLPTTILAKPIMQGSCDQIELQLNGKKYEIAAKNFKGSLSQ